MGSCRALPGPELAWGGGIFGPRGQKSKGGRAGTPGSIAVRAAPEADLRRKFKKNEGPHISRDVTWLGGRALLEFESRAGSMGWPIWNFMVYHIFGEEDSTFSPRWL